MKRKLITIFMVVALAISMGLIPAIPVAAAGSQVIWDIGIDDGSRLEFNHTDFGGSDTFTYDVATDTYSDFPAFLYVSGYAGGWEAAGVHEITILFETTEAYSNVQLEYQKFGGENDEMVLDVIVDTWFVLGPGESMAGTYYWNIGDLDAGSHSISIECTGVGTGEGAHTYDYLALTTPTWDITVNAEAGGSPLAVPVTGEYDSTSADGTTSYAINGIPDGNTVTLTAPLIHLEGSNVYSFLSWSIESETDPIVLGTTLFTVTEDTTATAYYQKLENYVTGGGNIKSEVVKRNRTIEKVDYTFGGNVGISDTLGIVGSFQIGDHTGKKTEVWHCTTGDFVYLAFADVDPDGLVPDPGAETPDASNDTVMFIGDFSSNGGNEATLAIMIWDAQEPGKDFDTIWVGELDETYQLVDEWIGSLFFPEIISGGNFQLHDYE